MCIVLLMLSQQGIFAQESPLQSINLTFNNASAIARGDQLVVSTGKIERTWVLTANGLLTNSVRDLKSDREWCSQKPGYKCDWDFPGLIDNNTRARLVSLTAKISDDEHFTSEHIEVVAEIHYETQVAVQYVIWVYPDAPGIRTQLKIKALHGMNQTHAENIPARNEYIPLNWSGLNRRAVGYYNNTQRMNSGNTKLLREEDFTATVLQPEKYDWASILVAEDDDGGLLLVKESHKCVNQEGLSTGAFHADASGFSSTGWGIMAKEIIADRWRPGWAHWCILYSGGDIDREMAIKRFDRTRYPVNPELDIYILANTWGSARTTVAAREESVLREIESQADLGIDVQQIDAGWQNPGNLPWTATTMWEPHPDPYPQGWKNVVNAAKKKGMKLGIWFAVGSQKEEFFEKYGNDWYADLEDLKKSYDQGGFSYYKFDMAYLRNYDDLESLMDMSREFVKYTGHNARINWDVTENEPRNGYFFGRDLGNIYLENRQSKRPQWVVYVPFIMLRDAWHVSKYINLNKFQISVQNIDETARDVSNGHLYNHPYAVAITLMGCPIFFQETKFYTEKARDEIRPLLAIYKQYREEMFKGFVLPVGDEPNDRSWTGFQNHNQESRSGFLMIFRELNNQDENKQVELNFVTGDTLKVTNLVTGEEEKLTVGTNGFAEFHLKLPASFLYLKYEIL